MSEAAEKLNDNHESVETAPPSINISDYQGLTWDTTVTYTSQTDNSIGEDTPGEDPQ